MDKEKKKRNKYNEEILKTLEKKFGYSIDYIRKSLRGDRTGTISEMLVEQYGELERKLKLAAEAFTKK